jgi:glycosidase
MLALYRFLLALRRSTPALFIGDYVSAAADENVLAYERRHNGDRLLVVLNMSSMPRLLILPSGTRQASLLASTLPCRREGDMLDGNEGLILRIEDAI